MERPAFRTTSAPARLIRPQQTAICLHLCSERLRSQSVRSVPVPASSHWGTSAPGRSWLSRRLPSGGSFSLSSRLVQEGKHHQRPSTSTLGSVHGVLRMATPARFSPGFRLLPRQQPSGKAARCRRRCCFHKSLLQRLATLIRWGRVATSSDLREAPNDAGDPRRAGEAVRIVLQCPDSWQQDFLSPACHISELSGRHRSLWLFHECLIEPQRRRPHARGRPARSLPVALSSQLLRQSRDPSATAVEECTSSRMLQPQESFTLLVERRRSSSSGAAAAVHPGRETCWM